MGQGGQGLGARAPRGGRGPGSGSVKRGPKSQILWGVRFFLGKGGGGFRALTSVKVWGLYRL